MSLRRRRLSVADLTKRFKEFSYPQSQRSVHPPDQERTAVRAFLTKLEDRRVLFNPFHLEVEYEVKQSILQIRQHCTDTMTALPEGSFAVAPIGGIRAACHRFLDEPLTNSRRFHQGEFYGPEGPEFFMALGEFRATVGMHVASLALHYQIDLEPELASLVPAVDGR